VQGDGVKEARTFPEDAFGKMPACVAERSGTSSAMTFHPPTDPVSLKELAARPQECWWMYQHRILELAVAGNAPCQRNTASMGGDRRGRDERSNRGISGES
jgi:hypothetical protein